MKIDIRIITKTIQKKRRAAAVLLFVVMAAIFASTGMGLNLAEGILPSFFFLDNDGGAYMNTHILESDPSLLPGEFKVPQFFATRENINRINTMEEVEKYIYNIESTAYATYEDLDPAKLLEREIGVDLWQDGPKILIFHTHSQEDFIDSIPGRPEDTIVGVGEHLAGILAEDYGISVVHDIGSYDMIDGKLVRGTSYENMEPAVSRILEKYPTIEVVIDLHRDGVADHIRLVETINGKDTARIMFFNGVTKYNDNGTPVAMPELENPYLSENLSLSLNLYLTANELYPGFARKNYIKPYRYSLHFRPMSMLVEVGANTNTVEEAMNAMAPLAEIIVETLGGAHRLDSIKNQGGV